MGSEQNIFKVQSKTSMILRKHHDSLIHIELILSSSYLMTKANKTKQKPESHKVSGKTGRRTGQNKNVYNYTTNLQIVLMFKDPLTSGSD